MATPGEKDKLRAIEEAKRQLPGDAQKLRTNFLLLADALDKRYDEDKIAECIGKSISTAGEVLSVAALILFPYVEGGCLLVAEFGTAVAAAGEGTSFIAVADDAIAEARAAVDVNKLWNDFRLKFVGAPDLISTENAMKIFGEDVKEDAVLHINKIMNAVSGANRLKRAAEAIQVAELAAEGVARAASLNCACMVYTIHDLINIAVEVHKHTKSKLGVPLRNIARELEKLSFMYG